MRTTRDTQVSIHGATAIKTRAMCMNGKWHREIVVTIGDDHDQVFTLVVYSDDYSNRLAVDETPDEWVNVELTDPDIVRSDKPFSAESSVNEGAKQ